MKTLFLIWHRSGRQTSGFFNFVPYLYGPCSFEVYSVLGELQNNGSISQPPHPTPRWEKYHLTGSGKKEAEQAAERSSPDVLAMIEAVTDEVAPLSFHELLRKVYSEAPDFAAASMFKELAR